MDNRYKERLLAIRWTHSIGFGYELMLQFKDVLRLFVVGWTFNLYFVFKVKIEALFSMLQDWFNIDNEDWSIVQH
jgi:hypothetical protein